SDWVPFPDLSVFARLTCPVQVIGWEQDPLHPFDLARRVAASFPDARLEAIAPLPAIFLEPEVVGRVYERSLGPSSAFLDGPRSIRNLE
ncbi:MAG: hypothetical protein M3R54_02615, partial [Chloroflexota bacterium]|nr:hypothetical protein [Chloroflexota bacterium]